MNYEEYSILETAGAVALTVFLVSVIKRLGVNAKFLPLAAVVLGIAVVGLGSMSGLIPIQGWAIVWYGIVTGILATSGWSGIKNVMEGFTDEQKDNN